MRILQLLFLVYWLGSFPLFAQIVDDTTREVYGRHSTRYFLQEDVYGNNPETRKLDTSLHYQHYYNYQYQKGVPHQYLGNLGTAMKPIYYKAPEEIGYRLGFEAFHPYLNKAQNQRYFDTKSPYTELRYVQGSTGEQRLFLLFSRNVNKYWNLGASYNRFTSTKQFAVVANRDFQTDHHQINAFTSVKTKQDKYKLLLNFNYMQHWAYESGGIKTRPNEGGVVDSGLYLYKYASVRLFRSNVDAARNYYKTTQLHLYHQFNPLDSGNRALQIFHEADWRKENQYFRDNNMRTDSAYATYYREVNFNDSLKSFYQYRYELLQNKLGLKGDLGRFFYAVYYKNRIYSLADTSQDPTTAGKSKLWFNDAFAGGDLAYRFRDDFQISLSGKVLVSFKTTQHSDALYYKSHGDYQLNAAVRYKKLSAEFGQSRISPSMMQTRMVYNLANWAFLKDSLKATESQNAALTYLQSHGNRYFKLGLAYQRIDHLVYFKRMLNGPDSLKIRPTQDKSYMDYVQPTLGFCTNWRWLYFENELILTHVFTEREVVHMPRWFAMPKLFFQYYLFKKATQVQTGVEMFLKADYYADDYAPQLNQYYWQNSYVVKTFPITHVFLNLQVSRATIFLKVTNVFGGQLEQTGYLETPYYAGMKRSFQFGVLWRAFD